jgi:23S rRNA (guanine745-N1)-methyltransferase
VRACGLPLASAERRLVCGAGHSFDRARSGYVNLLQPQDRRARAPGDSKETVAARSRLAETDLDRVLVDAVRAWARGRALGAEDCLLDVGAGVGTLCGALARELPCRAFGVDLAAPAMDAATAGTRSTCCTLRRRVSLASISASFQGRAARARVKC